MSKIAGVPRNEFLATVDLVHEMLLSLPENLNKERTGGFLFHMMSENRRFLLFNEIGTCQVETELLCPVYAQEKGHRLIDTIPHGYFTSWQSRNRDQKKYGGAVTAPSTSKGLEHGKKSILSYSGNTEHGDEALVVVVKMHYRWLTLEDAQQIAAISDNPLIFPLMDASYGVLSLRREGI